MSRTMKTSANSNIKRVHDFWNVFQTSLRFVFLIVIRGFIAVKDLFQPVVQCVKLQACIQWPQQGMVLVVNLIPRVYQICQNMVLHQHQRVFEALNGARMPVSWTVPIKFHLVITGNDRNSHQQFLKHLGVNLKEEEINQSDVVIAFIPVTSRVGTDIEAAFRLIPDSDHAVLVVLHHTFDQNAVVPESSRFVTKKKMFVVDCLFHEDKGLLDCPRNSTALKNTKKYLEEMTTHVTLLDK